jgi:poly-gamma-glutamate synthesis protein (capsule biosynthesis protein)
MKTTTSVLYTILPLILLVILLVVWKTGITGKETFIREHAKSEGVLGDKDHIAPQATILYVGDMMFDRYIRKMALKHGEDYLFSCISSTFKSYDVVVGNLEGPITTRPSTSMGSIVGSADNYTFTFPTSTASLLSRHNISIVTIGNNHILNQGMKGLFETKVWFTKNNVAYFGGVRGNDEVYRTEINSIPLSFVGYNQFGGDTSEVVARRITEETMKGRYVILYAHWGEEYVEVTDTVRDVAKEFVRSGARIIIGSHPHIIQEKETINGVQVYYSLGNFMFDQYFQENVMEGLVVSMQIDDRGRVTTQETKVSMQKDGRTCPQ